MVKTQHVEEEVLSALVDEEVPAAEARRAREHLKGCERCRRTFQGFRRTALLLGRLEHLSPPEPLVAEIVERARRRSPFREARLWGRRGPLPRPRNLLLPAAASVVLLAFLVLVAVREGMRSAVPPPEARPEAERQAGGPATLEKVVPREGLADSVARREEEEARQVAMAARNREGGPAVGGAAVPSPGRDSESGASPAAAGELPGSAQDLEDDLARKDRAVAPAGTEEATTVVGMLEAKAAAPPPPGAAGGARQAEHRIELRSPAGDLLGVLRLRFPALPEAAPVRGIRVLCDPAGKAGYGTEENPVSAPHPPEGFQWPEPSRVPERWTVPEAERLPALAVSVKGTLLVDRNGVPSAPGVATWLRGPLEALRFESGRCMEGDAAAARIPFLLDWSPS